MNHFEKYSVIAQNAKKKTNLPNIFTNLCEIQTLSVCD